MSSPLPGHEPCDAFIDIGPFRFECNGHLPGVTDRVRRYHDGKITHNALSPGDVGDVDVTFWTMLDDDDSPG
jgi:hypothetical protein